MSVSHHSSEAFILIPQGIISCVCSPERECVCCYFSPRASRLSCCSRSWLGGAGLHRGDLYPLVWWLAQREKGQAELCSNAGRIMDDGMGLEGRAEMPTSVQHTPHHPHRLPSAIAHHRRCQAVRLSDWPVEMRCVPLLSGQDLDLVGGFAGLGCACSFAYGEPRYDIRISFRTGAPPLLAAPAALLLAAELCRRAGFFWELGPHRSFSLQPQTKFSSFLPLGVSCLHTHTHIHTHTNTRTSFLFSPRTSHSHPPRPSQLDLPPHAATPNALLCTGALAAAARVELLRSLMLSVLLAPR